LRPSAQRYSMATVRPSIHPSSRSRPTKAAKRWVSNERPWELKYPIVGSLPAWRVRRERPRGCCTADERDEFAPSHRALPRADDRTLPHHEARCAPQQNSLSIDSFGSCMDGARAARERNLTLSRNDTGAVMYPASKCSRSGCGP
jgi:hypothetical protein